VFYPKLLINNSVIERVSTFNYLGVILSSTLKWSDQSSTLKWSDHINHISKKICRVIGVMYRLKHVYPQAILLTLYNTLIVPHFSYCLLVWGSKVFKNHPVHLLQKRALRIIKNTDYIAHSEPICKELNLMKVTDMFRFSVWKFYYKLMNNYLPPYFDSMKPVLPVVCYTHAIRNPKFHLPHIKHEFAEQLLKYQLIKILNREQCSNLITSKVHTHSYFGFKSYIKYRVIDTYVDNCTLIYCESCEHLARRQIAA